MRWYKETHYRKNISLICSKKSLKICELLNIYNSEIFLYDNGTNMETIPHWVRK